MCSASLHIYVQFAAKCFESFRRQTCNLQVVLENIYYQFSLPLSPQLAGECREILKHAIDVRESYRQNIDAILMNTPSKAEQVEADLEGFETDMKNVLKVPTFSAVIV